MTSKITGVGVGVDPGWFFPPLGGGEESGLNDPGIETFKKAERLAREITQNVLDNRTKVAREAGIPATVTFEYLDLPREVLPDVDRFTEILTACRDHVLSQYKDELGAGNEKQFFETALGLLSHATIPTLRAGDEGTTGLTGGDDDHGGSFWRLLRGQGYSSLQGPGGGTYGIGQRAPFAHSALRTILYSTRLETGERAYVAKCILASFPNPVDGQMAQKTGWWCEYDERSGSWGAVRDDGRIPSVLSREEVGTDLYVVGYLRDDWERSVRWSVLEHFFGAITQGDLCIRLMNNGNAIGEINSENIEEQLIAACDEARTVLTTGEYQKGLGATLHYFRALKNPVNGKPFEKKIAKLGSVKLFVHRDKAAPDRWCTMRKPRILVDSKGAGLLRGFAAVVLVDDDAGNEYLAKLEDPAHVCWHEDEWRGADSKAKREAREARLAIPKFVRETLKSLRAEGQPPEQDIPDLGRYLPEEDEATGEEAIGTASEPTGGTVGTETGLPASKDGTLEPTKKLTRRPSTGPSVSRPGGGGSGPGGPGRKGSSGQKGGRRQRGGGEGKEDTLLPGRVRFRSFLCDDGSYRVVLESDEDAKGDAILVAVGEDSDYPIQISLAQLISETPGSPNTDLEVAGDRLKGLSLKAGTPIQLLVRVESDFPICLAMGG